MAQIHFLTKQHNMAAIIALQQQLWNRILKVTQCVSFLMSIFLLFPLNYLFGISSTLCSCELVWSEVIVDNVLTVGSGYHSITITSYI